MLHFTLRFPCRGLAHFNVEKAWILAEIRSEPKSVRVSHGFELAASRNAGTLSELTCPRLVGFPSYIAVKDYPLSPSGELSPSFLDFPFRLLD